MATLQQDMIRELGDRIRATISTTTVYGEAVNIGGKTVVPVAKVCYGFGAGAGQGPEVEGKQPTGGGGGGGARVVPVGYLMEEAGEVKFVSIEDRKAVLIAGIAAFLVGLLLGRRLAGR